VTLYGSTARVFLIDSDRYQAYLDDDEYVFYGDFYDYSPVVLAARRSERGRRGHEQCRRVVRWLVAVTQEYFGVKAVAVTLAASVQAGRGPSPIAREWPYRGLRRGGGREIPVTKIK
jgi:hypothetical protein